MAGQRRVVAEDGIFDDRFAGAHSLEKVPQVRLHVVVVWTPERHRLRHGLVTQLRIILRVPLLLVSAAHGARKSCVVVAGSRVLPALWCIAQAEFRDFKDPLRALDAVGLRHLSALVQSHVDREIAVIKEAGLNVGHVTAILPAADSANRTWPAGELHSYPA